VRDKLRRYSLAMRHDSGGPKAVLFELLLGITLADIEHLAMEIERTLPEHPVTRVFEKPDGKVGCGVVLPVTGVGIHQGRVMPVTTGWELRYVGDRPRIVTAYIKGKKVT